MSDVVPRLVDAQYVVAVTAATSQNVSHPKPGTVQVHITLELEVPDASGAEQKAVRQRVRLSLTVPQFYAFLTSLEEARMAMQSANH